MNLVDGSMSGGTFSAMGIDVPGLAAPDGAVTLGFRAEDAQVVDSGGQIAAPVYSMELLGDATMVTVKIGDAQLSVKAAKDYRIEIGDTVSIAVPPAICHLFNAKDGARISLSAAE